MTTTRYWSDPLGGLPYGSRARLASSDMSAYVAALRSLDFMAFTNALRFDRLHSSNTYVGAAELADAGAIVALTETELHLLSVATPSLSLVSPIPLGTSIESCEGAYDGTGRVVFATGTRAYAYTAASGNVVTYETFASSASGTSVVWSPATSKYYAATGASGPNGYIQSSTDGTSWAVVCTSAGSLFSRIARSSDGMRVLATSSSGDKKAAYSADGGQTWTVYTLSATATHLSYDDRNGLWLTTSSSYVRSLGDPSVSVIWQNEGATPTRVRFYTGCTARDVIALPGGAWAVSVADDTYDGDVFLTTDRGATWERALGVSNYTGHRLRRLGQRLGVIAGGSGAREALISGAVWPEHVAAL